MTSEPDLERLDPESEASFDALCDRIAEELQARVSFGDDLSTAEGQTTVAGLIADAVLDRFMVRPRTAPRYRLRPSS